MLNSQPTGISMGPTPSLPPPKKKKKKKTTNKQTKTTTNKQRKKKPKKKKKKETGLEKARSDKGRAEVSENMGYDVARSKIVNFVPNKEGPLKLSETFEHELNLYQP